MASMLSALPVNVKPPTIRGLLLVDHRETVALCQHFMKLSKEPEANAQMLENLADAIALHIRLHSEGEMQVLYPALERSLGAEGGAAVKHCLEAHAAIEAEIKDSLVPLRKQPAKAAEHVARVLERFLAHLHEEEDEYMMKARPLAEGRAEGDLADVLARFVDAKAAAPLAPPKTK